MLRKNKKKEGDEQRGRRIEEERNWKMEKAFLLYDSNTFSSIQSFSMHYAGDVVQGGPVRCWARRQGLGHVLRWASWLKCACCMSFGVAFGILLKSGWGHVLCWASSSGCSGCVSFRVVLAAKDNNKQSEGEYKTGKHQAEVKTIKKMYMFKQFFANKNHPLPSAPYTTHPTQCRFPGNDNTPSAAQALAIYTYIYIYIIRI